MPYGAINASSSWSMFDFLIWFLFFRSWIKLDNSLVGLIVLDISKESEAYQKGVRVGDLILEAHQKKILSVNSLKDLIKDLKSSKKASLLFLLNSNGNLRFLSLRLD